MAKYILSVLFFLFATTLKAQYLNWFVSAQSGGTGYGATTNMHGAVLAGFKTETGQQFSVGPVFKGYMADQKFRNILGARLYSQVNLSGNLDVYMQCDISNGTPFQAVSMKSPLRLETGIGVNYMVSERFGVGAGYNFDDYNPLNNTRRSSPALKFVYVIPFHNSWGF